MRIFFGSFPKLKIAKFLKRAQPANPKSSNIHGASW